MLHNLHPPPPMSTAGLSRRRVGAAGSSDSTTTTPAPEHDERLRAPSNYSRSQSEPSDFSAQPTNTHAGSAFAGGSKIAYDPRDLDQDAQETARIGGKMPRLTIMEEVLLLGIKDKQVGFLCKFRSVPAGWTACYGGLSGIMSCAYGDDDSC